jgi:hypothetical protein
MKKNIILSLLLCLASLVYATDYPGIDQLNSTNWVKWFDQTLGYRYDSHGCLHFSPADIYLIAQTIPPGIPLTVKKYKFRNDEPAYDLEKVPFLADKVKNDQEVKELAATFKTYQTELVYYPTLNTLVVLVNNYPFAQIAALAGPPQDFLMAYDVQPGKPVQWDFMLTTPTDPGNYTILKVTDHYLSSAYYKNTIVPFGAWLEKVNGVWSYQENGRWYKLPDNVVADLARGPDERVYDYYDLNVDSSGQIVAARYAGHDFGKYVLLWTKDGKYRYPEMGYAAGELVYEQIILVKELVYLLTAPGSDDFATVVAQDKNLAFYRDLSLFISTKGKAVPANVQPVMLSYYRLFNGFELSEKDRTSMDPRLVKAFYEYAENRLPRDQRARWEALGLYYYLRVNSLVIDKQAGWYERIKKDWGMFSALRHKLQADFDQLGVLSLANRQNIVEQWLTDRLEFKQVGPPKGAKNLGELSFNAFFKPDEESPLFSEREKEVMIAKIKAAVKGDQETGLNLNIVPALNNYNLGVLLNDILGDLYKSHGCLHVSPRNMIFLYDLLPIGAQMKVYPYSMTVSEESLSSIPYLADLINFRADLEAIKDKFLITSEVQIAVYPSSGDWLIYLKGTPFARLTIKGGGQEKFYLVQDRDAKGRPIFEGHLAYPTTPGDYYIFKRTENYVSNLYYDQTIVPMGGLIKQQKGKWIFQNKNGNWKELPPALIYDLKQPIEKQAYTYYDQIKNSSGEVVAMKWGSHPFGLLALQTSVDRRTAWPELIHSSGDLMMEERQLVNDLIRILTAPSDDLDQCLPFSQNFDLYKICADFVANPDRTDLIQPKERAAYRLHFGLPLTASEEALLPPDVLIADKIVHKKPLTEAENQVLINEGIAYRRSGNLKINMEKILGLKNDTYQYVVTIQKYAHHYETLKRRWPELSALRLALLKDFNNFVLKDQDLFQNFMRELMLKRNNLEEITQPEAIQLLNKLILDNSTGGS